jgi:anti-sigma factor RsiW
MHLDDEQIQRLLHDELDAAARAASRRHVAECVECRQRLAEAEREEQWVFDLLRRMDAPAPLAAGDVEWVARRAGARTTVAWMQRAAGLVLAVLLGWGAYAAPGSPLPRWVDRVTGWIARPDPSRGPELEPESAPAGIAVAPGPRFTIRFAEPQTAGAVAVSLTDAPNVAVRALGGTATFTTDLERLTIANPGSLADYEIELPRSAPWVEITIGERRLLLKDGARLVPEMPTDAQGRRFLRLAP